MTKKNDAPSGDPFQEDTVLLAALVRAIEFRSACLASHADESKQSFADERFWDAYDKAKARLVRWND